MVMQRDFGASVRGIDLILEAGMNVRVCSFPEGEDPDSFAKNTPFEALVLFLQENAKDFIQFKASLLAEQSGNDPIKKAETIREIVKSISKIPDHIKKEVYVKTCAQINGYFRGSIIQYPSSNWKKGSSRSL